MTAADYDAVVRFVHDRAGIVLEPGKEYLVDSRLVPLARKHGLAGISAVVAKLRVGQLAAEVIDAMVTTETSFFRDGIPFDTLRTAVLPPLLDRRATTRQLSIWCAAAASGQEPYTIAILLKEHFPELSGWRIEFLATDLSSEMLRRARDGWYSAHEVARGLSAPLLAKYFRPDRGGHLVRDDLRAGIDFRPLNLTDPFWPVVGQFDIIFLRNVMIYFDVPTKQAVLGRVRRVLKPDGHLLLGGAETTYGLDDAFERAADLAGGFYRRCGVQAP